MLEANGAMRREVRYAFSHLTDVLHLSGSARSHVMYLGFEERDTSTLLVSPGSTIYRTNSLQVRTNILSILAECEAGSD